MAAKPFISSLTPDFGSPAGGTIVTAHGGDFSATDGIYIGDTTYVNTFLSRGPSFLEFVAPAKPEGEYAVVATPWPVVPRITTAWPAATATRFSVVITPREWGSEYCGFRVALAFEGAPGWSGAMGWVELGRSAATEIDPGFGPDPFIGVGFVGPAGSCRTADGHMQKLEASGRQAIGAERYDWEVDVPYRITIEKAGTFSINGGGNWWTVTIENLNTLAVDTGICAVGINSQQGNLVTSAIRFEPLYVGTVPMPASIADFTVPRINAGVSPTSLTPIDVDTPFATVTGVADGYRISFDPPTSPTFTYTPFTGPAPTVSSVSPDNGRASGGTTVTITGTNFVDVIAVRFGGEDADFTVDSSTQITATAPQSPGGGEFHVVVVSSSGGPSDETSADLFEYQQVSAVYTDVEFGGDDYTQYSFVLKVDENGSPDDYDWFTSFRWRSAGADIGTAYVGLSNIGAGISGNKCVFFDATLAADADSAVGGAVVAADGSGFQTRIPYAWVTGREYRIRVYKGTLDGSGQWWNAEITDLVTSTTTQVSRIAVSSGWGDLAGTMVAASERIGTFVSCSEPAYASADFTTLRVNSTTAPTSLAARYGVDTVCPNRDAAAITGGYRHRLGVADPLVTIEGEVTEPTEDPTGGKLHKVLVTVGTDVNFRPNGTRRTRLTVTVPANLIAGGGATSLSWRYRTITNGTPGVWSAVMNAGATRIAARTFSLWTTDQEQQFELTFIATPNAGDYDISVVVDDVEV